MKVKSKSVVTPTVAESTAPAVKAGPERKAILACVGLRGVVLSAGYLSNAGFRPAMDVNGSKAEFNPRPVTLGEKVTACWKGSGAESLWGKAVGMYVSPAGESCRVFELSKALSSGVIRKVKGTVEGKAAELYVPASWSDKMELPSYIGADNNGGRVESFGHPKGAARQAGFARAVSIGAASYVPKAAGAAKPTKAAPKAQPAPAKAKGKTPAPVKTSPKAKGTK